MTEATPENLILLVGSNPLPNYIVAKMLRPKRIWLIYSRGDKGTERVKECLDTALSEDLPGVLIEAPCLESATDAREVRQILTQLPHDAHLNYTGGTKIMAAHARLAFAEQQRRAGVADFGDANASYLDERDGVLRFDGGTYDRLTDARVGLTLDRLLQLHGTRKSKPSTHGLGPTEADAEALAQYVFRQPNTAAELYKRYCDIEPDRTQSSGNALDPMRGGNESERKKEKGSERLKKDPFIPPEGLRLSRERIPAEGMGAKPIDKWQTFLTGGWLEMWLGSQVGSYGDVTVSVNCFGDRRPQFEVDVAVIRNCRLYLVSCTTDTSKDLCKSKLFEVAMRGRQIGGDLARTALVSLLHSGSEQGSYVEQLRSAVKSVWGASNTPQVFGLDDLSVWAGIDQAANRASLEAWLSE
jgi:hypothetical protein